MALIWTSATDVTSRWIGDEIPATTEQINVLLEDAEDTVLGEYPDLADVVDADDGIPAARVKKVIARMVIRHLRNPEGVRTLQQGAGPYQESTTYGGDSPGALYLTDADRAELGQSKIGGAFTIDALPADYTGPEPPDAWSVIYG